MRDSIQIRPAQPADAEVAAVLLYLAYTQMQLTYPLGEEQESGWIKRLEQFFRQGGNRFSYQNTQVAVHNSEVVGLVLSFGGRDEARLNAAVGPWLEREAKDDEWYVDALAVLKNWGRKGIGTRLLETAEQLARQHHYPKIALHVAQGNKTALDLYTRLHYVVTEQTFLYQRPFVRMVKMLDNNARSTIGQGSSSPRSPSGSTPQSSGRL
jgi:ribosomal protein S18 acetylase RimI-like enzyme